MTLYLYGHFTESKLGKTGLTVTADVYRLDRATGAATLIVSGGACVEIGGGLYRYMLTAADLTLYDYVAALKTATTSVDLQHVPALWTDFSEGQAEAIADAEAAALDAQAAVNAMGSQLDAIESKTALIGATSVKVVSPVAANGKLKIVRGDDYAAADGRALEWTGTWPDLTGATITFSARRTGSDPIVLAGEVVTPVAPGQRVRLELLASDTDDAEPGDWDYDVEATLTSGRIVTLALDRLEIVSDITRPAA